MARTYDAIVAGGGHNGLICAAYLAAAMDGDVLVLERRPIVGGACVTEEIFPGFKFSTTSYVCTLLRPEIIRDLGLRRHGLEFIPTTAAFVPFRDGRHLLTGVGEREDRRAIATFSENDADAVPRFYSLLARIADAVRPILSMPAPDIGHLAPSDILGGAKLLPGLRKLSRFERGQLVKLSTMSCAAYLDEWFESDHLKATMAASSTIGVWGSPRSPGTAYVMLHYWLGDALGPGTWAYVRGGMGGITQAIARCCEERGVEIRTGSPVARVTTCAGRATGVVLEGGEEIRAPVIVSGADPRHTFLEWLDRSDLPAEFVRGVERIRFTGNSCKVNLALSELPDFTALPGNGVHLTGDIQVCGESEEYLEAAFDDFKRGKVSRAPYLDVVLPSTLDDTLAPPGKHVMSIAAKYVPYRPARGPWNEKRSEELGDLVVNTLAEHAPNLPGSILNRQVITPLDYEEEYGLTGGNIVHGDMALDQMFSMRPVPGWAGYRSPIRNLYLCGSGAHPGGGVMGAPGRNAAVRIIKDQRGKRPTGKARSA